MFNLAITFGLKREPLAALERLKGLVEDVGRRHGVEYPLQMTLGLSYGQRLYAVRYSSERQSRSLFHSRSMQALQQINPARRRSASRRRAPVSLQILRPPCSTSSFSRCDGEYRVAPDGATAGLWFR